MVEQLLVNGIIAGGIYSLIAIGFSLVFQTTRFFNFSFAAVYASGAYFAYLFYVQLGYHQFFAFPLACICASLVGILCELAVYRPMRKQKATNLTLLLASLGLYTILQNMISLAWGDDIKTMRTGEVVEGHVILGARITDIQIIIIASSLAMITLTTLMLGRSKHGKTLRALANDPELARLSGINSDRYILFAFAIGSFLAAIAAIMISFETDLTPTMGFNALMMAVVAVIVGGVTSLPGAALGGILIGLTQNLGVVFLPSKWQDTIVFVVLIIFLMFKPNGILGKKSEMQQM